MTIIYEGKYLAIVDIGISRAKNSDFELLDDLHEKGFWIQRVEERDDSERYFLYRDYKEYVKQLEEELTIQKSLQDEPDGSIVKALENAAETELRLVIPALPEKLEKEIKDETIRN